MAPLRRQIKKIENKSSRQVTFSKRRTGLFKKAKELAVLCDASIALFTFSPGGKLFEYSSSNMKMIIDKYLNFSATFGSSISSRSDDNVCDLLQLHPNDIELEKMNQLWKDLMGICKQMRGQDLEGLEFKQLEELEDGLKRGLTKIKARKDELLMEKNQEYLQTESEVTQENRNLEAHSGQRQLRTAMECRNQRSNDHHHNGEKEDFQDSLTALHLGLPGAQ